MYRLLATNLCMDTHGGCQGQKGKFTTPTSRSPTLLLPSSFQDHTSRRRLPRRRRGFSSAPSRALGINSPGEISPSSHPPTHPPTPSRRRRGGGGGEEMLPGVELARRRRVHYHGDGAAAAGAGFGEHLHGHYNYLFHQQHHRQAASAEAEAGAGARWARGGGAHPARGEAAGRRGRALVVSLEVNGSPPHPCPLFPVHFCFPFAYWDPVMNSWSRGQTIAFYMANIFYFSSNLRERIGSWIRWQEGSQDLIVSSTSFLDSIRSCILSHRSSSIWTVIVLCVSGFA